MEAKNAAKLPVRWNLELHQSDEAGDPAWLWEIDLSVVIEGRAGSLRGRVVVYDGDPPFVDRIWENDFLLPERQAQRLLCRLWEDWHGAADDYGAIGIGAILNLEEWLADHYEDRGSEVLSLIRTTLRTFV